jgi:hypothetical protein
MILPSFFEFSTLFFTRLFRMRPILKPNTINVSLVLFLQKFMFLAHSTSSHFKVSNKETKEKYCGAVVFLQQTEHRPVWLSDKPALAN